MLRSPCQSSGSDLKKEYQISAVAMDLPRGHHLRMELTTVRVSLSQLRDELLDAEVERLTDAELEAKFEKAAKQVGAG